MDILAKALSDVLARVASDYALDHAELVSRYLSSSAPPPKPAALRAAPPSASGLCTALTAKGLPCKYKPQRGSCVCRIHASKSDPDPPPEPAEVPPKKKKAPKRTKAKAPEHSHALSEDLSPDNVCQLCDTHGSVADPGLPDAEFELADDDDMDLAARLKAILAEDPGDLEVLEEDEDFEDDQVILARLKAITSSSSNSNSLTVSVAELLR
jgi:hypothetical protein